MPGWVQEIRAIISETRMHFFLLLAVVLATPYAGATILTFDNLGLANSLAIPGAYGDNVTTLCDAVGCYGTGNGFTPDVTTSYNTVRISDDVVVFTYIDFWDNGYGDLVNVGFAATTPGYYGEVVLTAAPGWQIRLNSFDLGGWPEANYLNQPVRILDQSGNILIDYSPTTIQGAGPSHSTFTPNLTVAGSIRIQWGNNFNTGIDNINFDQVPLGAQIPEPGTWTLLALGAAAVWVGRRNPLPCYKSR